MNALLQGAVHGIHIEGATLYSTTYPCSLSAKMLINCGIKHIIYAEAYPDRLAKEMLRQAGIKVVIAVPGHQDPTRR